MDILSDILSAARLDSAVLGVFRARSPWGIDCSRNRGVVFHYVLSGACCLCVEERPPVLLKAGMAAVLPQWPHHALASSPDVAGESIMALIVDQGQPTWTPGQPTGRPVQISVGGDGEACDIFSGVFALHGSGPSLLIDALPAWFIIDTAETGLGPWLARSLELVAEEAQAAAPGHEVVVARLADLLLVQLLRAHMRDDDGAVGTLRGLSDPALARALSAMHAAPQQPWTVARMAGAAGLSRSVFAERFTAAMGLTPMAYLTRWRLELAAGRLTSGREPLAAIAEAAGYRTLFAFSRAFARQYGTAPGAYRKSQRKLDRAMRADHG